MATANLSTRRYLFWATGVLALAATLAVPARPARCGGWGDCSTADSLMTARLLVRDHARQTLPCIPNPPFLLEDENWLGPLPPSSPDPGRLARVGQSGSYRSSKKARAFMSRLGENLRSRVTLQVDAPKASGHCNVADINRKLASRLHALRTCGQQSVWVALADSARIVVRLTLEDYAADRGCIHGSHGSPDRRPGVGTRCTCGSVLGKHNEVVENGVCDDDLADCVSRVIGAIHFEFTGRGKCTVLQTLTYHAPKEPMPQPQCLWTPGDPPVRVDGEVARTENASQRPWAELRPEWPENAPPEELRGWILGLLSDTTYVRCHAELVRRGRKAAPYLLQILNAPPGHPAIRYFEEHAQGRAIRVWEWRDGWRIPLVLADMRGAGVSRALLYEMARPLSALPVDPRQNAAWATQNVARLRVISWGLAATMDAADVGLAFDILDSTDVDWIARIELAHSLGFSGGPDITSRLAARLPVEGNSAAEGNGKAGAAPDLLPGGRVHWELVRALLPAVRPDEIELVKNGSCGWKTARGRWAPPDDWTMFGPGRRKTEQKGRPANLASERWESGRKVPEQRSPELVCREGMDPDVSCLGTDKLDDPLEMIRVCGNNRKCYAGVLLEGAGVNSITGERFEPSLRCGWIEHQASRARCRAKAALELSLLPPESGNPVETLDLLTEAWMELPGSDNYDDTRFALLLAMERAGRTRPREASERAAELVRWYGRYEPDRLNDEWAWRLAVLALQESTLYASTQEELAWSFLPAITCCL